jgi:hypothetical protein
LCAVLYGKIDGNGVNLDGQYREDIMKLLKLPPLVHGCFFPEDYGYMVINIEEGKN